MSLNNPIFEDAADDLDTEHSIASYNQSGACIATGYSITSSRDGRARVACRTPQPDLLDGDRVSDEMAAERHRMVDAYAATLTRLGWRVERRGPRSKYPYLLAGCRPRP